MRISDWSSDVCSSDLRDHARIDEASYKRNQSDFVLWKPADGEVGWDSPWGAGRPGWHIECSAMISEHLGATIDIHGGGQDLIFPHHEAECAQSECYHHAPLARYWVRSEEHTSELQSLMRISYAVFCLKKKK